MSEFIANDAPIIESVRAFIQTCPHLPEYYNSLGVDRLEENISSYSVEAVPCNPIVKTYVNGDTIRQFEFHFNSTEAFTLEVLDQIENSSFFEKYSGWLEECTNKRSFPELSGDRTAFRIEALTHGYIADSTETTARYCIQCRLIYSQKRRR